MTDQKDGRRCYCRPCVFGRRVSIVVIGAIVLPFWIVWSIVYGLLACLLFGEASLLQLAKKDWNQ